MDDPIATPMPAQDAPVPTAAASAPVLHYTPLERIALRRPIERIAYIVAACAGRRVLDLGAMDETAWQAKRGQGTWLHEEIGAVAARVDGFDSSSLVTDEGLTTGPRSTIRRGNITDIAALLAQLDELPDVVVAGEIIEHLEDPLRFLSELRNQPGLVGRTLILSTPNATALHNCLIALGARESTHHDHLCIFSYKTLNTLCLRAGFSGWSIVPYVSRFTEMRARNHGWRGLLLAIGERTINAVEWTFPMLSFGYVVVILI
jgi:hypothetical protein